MWRSRTFWRLFGTFGVLPLLAVGLLGAIIVGQVERHYLKQIEDRLLTQAVLVREVVRNVPPDPVVAASTAGLMAPTTGQSTLSAAAALLPGRSRSRLLQQCVVGLTEEIAARGEMATRITLIADDGLVLADSQEDPWQMEKHAADDKRLELKGARDHGFGQATRFSTTLHQDMMYVALYTRDGGEVAFVRAALPLREVQEQLAGLRRLVWTAVLVTGAAVLALAFWLARRITRPLRELTAGAELIASGGYGHKVYAAGRDEVGALARAFNHMSERLAAQFALLEEDREQLRMILGGMVEGVVALDGEQRILFANQRAAQLLRLKSEALTGRKLWEVVRRRSLQKLVQRALAGPEPCQEELNWDVPTAQSLTVHAARLPGSPPRGAVLVLHDTSELRRLERLRREFVANVSHELKTPLSVIKACVETLLEGAVDDPEHCGPFLEKIDEQADRLHALILDLLSLARIESGEEVLDFQAVPLAPVVAACVEAHRARAEGKGLRLEAVPPGADAIHAETTDGFADVMAWADEEAVRQILDNLVDNALKYTPAGGRVRVRWHADDGQVCLEVEDTGIGIPEQDLARIFERFYRVDKARSRELGGTGLGLSIVKHLAQAMHGSVRAASRVGEGTTFTVRLSRPAVS